MGILLVSKRAFEEKASFGNGGPYVIKGYSRWSTENDSGKKALRRLVQIVFGVSDRFWQGRLVVGLSQFYNREKTCE